MKQKIGKIKRKANKQTKRKIGVKVGTETRKGGRARERVHSLDVFLDDRRD